LRAPHGQGRQAGGRENDPDGWREFFTVFGANAEAGVADGDTVSLATGNGDEEPEHCQDY